MMEGCRQVRVNLRELAWHKATRPNATSKKGNVAAMEQLGTEQLFHNNNCTNLAEFTATYGQSPKRDLFFLSVVF